MGINDIEKKILDDAHKEAQQLIVSAQEGKREQLAAVKKTITAEQAVFEKKLKTSMESSLEQKRQLLQMESDQEILKTKRLYLQNVYQQIISDISSDTALLQKYVQALNAELKQQGYVGEIAVGKKQAAEPIEIKIGNASIKTSITEFVLDKLKGLEAEVAATLFN